ncbi:hypothetical protein LX32DRAFT_392082 [Colletotrichum zoysiae]|uniref:Uncharacterized protein n=1 Tax=Colletotrichum zoysiae TaxID=1216348 RepID=A0AAD9HIF9_9PEZI|nr:hypothetical protein LX32DRAFT_392082 [Colletotrichum zoysiae]
MPITTTHVSDGARRDELRKGGSGVVALEPGSSACSAFATSPKMAAWSLIEPTPSSRTHGADVLANAERVQSWEHPIAPPMCYVIAASRMASQVAKSAMRSSILEHRKQFGWLAIELWPAFGPGPWYLGFRCVKAAASSLDISSTGPRRPCSHRIK